MKRPKINKDLVPFKMVYFCRNAGCSFLSFVAPIANQRGISPEGIGIIWTINPLISTVFNVACSIIADAWKIHRAILIAISALLLASYTTYFFLPSIPVPLVPSIHISINAQYLENDTSLILCPIDYDQTHVTKMFPLCNFNHSHPDVAAAEVCDFKCKALQYIHEDEIYIPMNISQYDPFVMSSQSVCREEDCFRADYNGTTNWIQQSNKIDTGEIALQLDCDIACSVRDSEGDLPLPYLLSTVEFWLTALCVIAIYTSQDTNITMTDTMCFVVLGKNRHRYGETRFFGSLGWGLVGASMGGLVNLCSKGQSEINYTPAMVISSCFLFLNLIFTSRLDVQVPGKKSEGTEGNVKSILMSFSCILLLATALIMGITNNALWTFEFIYISTVALEWDPNFSDLNLVFGLIILIKLFIEAPFVYSSGYIIKRLSHIHTFSLTLMVMSIRLLLISTITNPWIFVAVNILHGPSFGLYMANVISYAQFIAPGGAKATMQSIVSGSFKIGKATGALIGGLLIEAVGGSKAFFILGLIVTFYTIVYIIVNCAVQRCTSNATQGDDRGAYKTPNEDEKTEDMECGNGQIGVEDDDKKTLDDQNYEITGSAVSNVDYER